MIIDFNNCFQRNLEVLQDVCQHRVDMANFFLSYHKEQDHEDRLYYESQIRHYKHYDV